MRLPIIEQSQGFPTEIPGIHFIKQDGGRGGIRTHGTGVNQYKGLAILHFRPLSHPTCLFFILREIEYKSILCYFEPNEKNVKPEYYRLAERKTS